MSQKANGVNYSRSVRAVQRRQTAIQLLNMQLTRGTKIDRETKEVLILTDQDRLKKARELIVLSGRLIVRDRPRGKK